MESPLSKSKGTLRLPVLLRPILVWRYLRDGRAPLLPKLALALAILYAVFPLDLIPDAAPILGWLDDAGALALAGAWLARVLARYERETREPT